MRKKFFVSAASLMIIIAGLLFMYFKMYDVENNKLAILKRLETILGRQNLTLIDMVRLDETSSYIVLFTLQNGDIGYAQMVEGLNNKLKCKRAGYGTNKFSYQKIETNGGEYGIIVGKNLDLKVDRVTVSFLEGDHTFTFHINNKQYFVVYKKLPNKLQRAYPVKLTFYDKNNNVIASD